MENSIIEILQVFIKKHTISTVVSIVVSIIGIAFFPDFLGLTDRVGKFLTAILWFCICFLFIHLLYNIKCWCNNKIDYLRIKQSKMQYIKQENKENLEKLWTFVDSLNTQDREYLMTFLKNNNKPIEKTYYPFMSSLLDNDELIVSTQKPVSDSTVSNNIENNNTYARYCSQVRLYKLREEFYEILKFSYDKYHKISHFDIMEEK